MKNTIKADGGAETYTNEILQETDVFVESLPDPEKIAEPQVFTALLNTLYQRIFKPQPKNWQIYEQNRYHSRQRSILDYDDCEVLDQIWNCYMQLCVTYDQIPTLLDFSVLTGIRNDEFTRWINGAARSKTDEHCRTAKRWKETCESVLAKRAIQSNSIGSIFALKACHNWRESAPVTEAEYLTTTQATPTEIMERYKDAEKPELPDLSD